MGVKFSSYYLSNEFYYFCTESFSFKEGIELSVAPMMIAFEADAQIGYSATGRLG